MSSSNNDNTSMSAGSFRPHPRSPHIKQQLSYPQYPSTAEGFIPLSYSSPLPSNKQFKDYKYTPNSPQNYYPGNSWHNNSRNFFKHRKFPPRNFNNSYNRNDESNSGKFYYNHGNKKNFTKMNEKNINAYFHPSMLEDPWKILMEQYKQSNYTNKDETRTNSSPMSNHQEQETDNENGEIVIDCEKSSESDMKDSESSLIT